MKIGGDEKRLGVAASDKAGRGVLKVWANYLSSGSGFSALPLCRRLLLLGVTGDTTKLCIITSGFSAKGNDSPE